LQSYTKKLEMAMFIGKKKKFWSDVFIFAISKLNGE